MLASPQDAVDTWCRFCWAASITIVSDWAMQLTFFLAVFVMSERRASTTTFFLIPHLRFSSPEADAVKQPLLTPPDSGDRPVGIPRAAPKSGKAVVVPHALLKSGSERAPVRVSAQHGANIGEGVSDDEVDEPALAQSVAPSAGQRSTSTGDSYGLPFLSWLFEGEQPLSDQHALVRSCPCLRACVCTSCCPRLCNEAVSDPRVC